MSAVGLARGGQRAAGEGRGRGLHALAALCCGLLAAWALGPERRAALGEDWVLSALAGAGVLCAMLALLVGWAVRSGARGVSWLSPGLVLWVGAVLLGLAWWGVRIERASPARLDVLLAEAGVRGVAEGGEGAPLRVRLLLMEQPRFGPEPAGWSGRAWWSRPMQMARGRVLAVRAGELWVGSDGVVTVLLPAGARVMELAGGREDLGAGGVGRAPAAGDELEVAGWYRGVVGPLGPEQIDTRALAAQDGRVGSIRVERASGAAGGDLGGDALMRVAEGESTLGVVGAAGARWWGALAWLRRGASGLLDSVVPAGDGGGGRAGIGSAGDSSAEDDRAAPRGPAAAMLRAMLLGESDAELSEAAAVLAPLGLVHVLSISGFHLALVAWVVLMLVRLSGDRGAWEWAIAALAVGAYLLMVPGEAPVLRSGIMLLALLAGEALGRRHDRLSTLGFAGFVLLLWRPADVLTPGFQLSFLTTGVLLWRGAWASGVLMRGLGSTGLLGLPGVLGRARSRRVAAWARGVDWCFTQVVTLVACAVLATLASAPLVMVHAGIAPGWGVLAGAVLGPLAAAGLVLGVLALLLGLLASAVMMLLPWDVLGLAGAVGTLSRALGDVGVWLCGRVVLWAGAIGDAPGSAAAVGPVPLWWGLALSVVVLLGMWCVSARGRAVVRGGLTQRWRRVGLAVCAGALVVLVAAAAMQRTRAALPREVVVRAQGLTLSGSHGTVVRVRSDEQGPALEGPQLIVDPGSAVWRGGARAGRWVDLACGPGAAELVVTGASVARFAHTREVLARVSVARAWVSGDVLGLARERPSGPQAELLTLLAGKGVEVRELSRDGPTRIGLLEVMVPGRGAARVRVAGGAERAGAGRVGAGWLSLSPVHDEGADRAWRAEMIDGGGVRGWRWEGGAWVR